MGAAGGGAPEVQRRVAEVERDGSETAAEEGDVEQELTQGDEGEQAADGNGAAEEGDEGDGEEQKQAAKAFRGCHRDRYG